MDEYTNPNYVIQLKDRIINNTKIHHQINLIAVIAMDFGIILNISKVLDARRRAATTEAYK